ncbi:MAG: hypothetical protein AB7O45_03520, partial [Alphaproteobacteria bacterium]
MTRRAIVGVSAVALPLIGLFAAFGPDARPNGDVSWYLLAAERWLAGGRYGTEILEVNPPLAILLPVPSVLVARAIGIDPSVAHVLWTMALVGASAALAAPSLARLLPGPTALQAAALACYAVAVGAVPGHEIGQRDHHSIILALPYLLAAAAGDLTRPGIRPAILIAVAAVGVLVKPYFILLPALVLLALWPGAGSRRGILLARHVLWFGLPGAAFGGLVLVAFPEWLDVVRLALGTYRGYDAPGAVLAWAVAKRLAVAIAVAALAWCAWPPGWRARIAAVHLAGVAAYVGAAAMQGKSFDNHFDPPDVLNTLATLLALLRLAADGRAAVATQERRRRMGAAALAAVLPLYALQQESRAAAQIEPRASALDGPLAVRLSALPRGTPVLLVSTGLHGFPLVPMLGLRWGSAGPCYWMLPGIAQRLAAGERGPAIEALSSRQRALFLDDIRRFRPALIGVRRAPHPGGPPLDPLDFLRADRAVARALEAYVP